MKNVATLSVKEVMARTGLPRRLVTTLVANGALKSVRGPGRNSHIRIFETSVDSLPDRQQAAWQRADRMMGRDADEDLPPCQEDLL